MALKFDDIQDWTYGTVLSVNEGAHTIEFPWELLCKSGG